MLEGHERKDECRLTNAPGAFFTGKRLQIPLRFRVAGLLAFGKNLSRKLWTGIGPIVKPEVWSAILYIPVSMSMLSVVLVIMKGSEESVSPGKYGSL